MPRPAATPWNVSPPSPALTADAFGVLPPISLLSPEQVRHIYDRIGPHYDLFSAMEAPPKDAAVAAAWLRKAAEQGDAAAQSRLGDMYDDGDGVEKDASQAADRDMVYCFSFNALPVAFKNTSSRVVCLR